MKITITIKIEDHLKKLFKVAAEQAGEDFTEFMVNSAMLRIQNHLLDKKPKSAMVPFVDAMREAAAHTPKAELTAEDLKAGAASRKARAKGAKGLSVTEAIKVIRGYRTKGRS